MAHVLSAWEEHCGDFHLPPKLSSRLARAGLRILRREVIPILNPEYDPDTYSHGLIGLIVSFAPGRRGVSLAEVQAWADDLRTLGKEGGYFFSLNRYLFLVGKPESTNGT